MMLQPPKPPSEEVVLRERCHKFWEQCFIAAIASGKPVEYASQTASKAVGVYERRLGGQSFKNTYENRYPGT